LIHWREEADGIEGMSWEGSLAEGVEEAGQGGGFHECGEGSDPGSGQIQDNVVLDESDAG
jgi:hypothetical protein